jgi:hypothetical protein
MGLPASNDNGNPPSRRSVEEVLDSLDLSDVDVPAAVVCARCGTADCAGSCMEARSGVIAIIAWERGDAPVLRRLWQTARATTRDPEGFFEAMPDGPIAPALRFAMLSELVAAAAMVLALAPIAVMIAPSWTKELVLDASSRSALARAFFVGVPGLAAMLVLAHAAHGLSLDLGARRNGGRSARSRALRFGLYASGWDLVLGPVGAVVLAVKEGLGSLAVIGRLGAGLPSRSARAFLRGAYGLYGPRADRAVRVSYYAAIASTLFAAFAILAAVIALVLA